MKRLFLNIIAVSVIGVGGLYLTAPIANAVPERGIQFRASCLDMGCIGGDLKCYEPAEGGMCFTGGPSQDENEIE